MFIPGSPCMDLLGIADKGGKNRRWSRPDNALTKVRHVANITVGVCVCVCERERERESCQF